MSKDRHISWLWVCNDPYQYSRVCGRVRAYQFGTTNAFASQERSSSASIDSAYVDGVSLTHGLSPREHVWTFAAGLHKRTGEFIDSVGRCNDAGSPLPPTFVGNDYFCESGNPRHIQMSPPPPTPPPNPPFYSADPLWDGDGCDTTITCCVFNTPPWFHKQLSDLSTDDIEMRVCINEDVSNEDVAIDIVEIYAQ